MKNYEKRVPERGHKMQNCLCVVCFQIRMYLQFYFFPLQYHLHLLGFFSSTVIACRKEFKILLISNLKNRKAA